MQRAARTPGWELRGTAGLSRPDGRQSVVTNWKAPDPVKGYIKGGKLPAYEGTITAPDGKESNIGMTQRYLGVEQEDASGWPSSKCDLMRLHREISLSAVLRIHPGPA